MKKGPKGFTISFPAAQRRREKYITPGEYQKQKKLLSVLEKTSQYLAAETNIELILKRIANTLGKTLEAKYVNFWDFTPDKKSLFILTAYGMQRQYIEHSRKTPIRVGTAWVGRAVQTKKPWATSDVLKDPRLPRKWLPPSRKQNYHGLLCLPLMKGNEVIGGMCIYYKDVHEFEYFEMSLANIVANQAATALSNARLFNEVISEQNKTLATIHSLKDGLIMYDLEGKVLFFNPKAEEFLWLKAQDVIGKKISEKLERKNIYWKNLWNIKRLVQIEYATREYTTEGPQKLVLEVTYVPVRDQQYRKIGVMQILRNITREKEVELLKSSFVSVASHQLRTPLSAIKWSLNILKEGMLGPLSFEQKEMLDKTIGANDRLINLVADLLDVSRIEEGKFGYNFRPGNLIILVKKIFHNLKSDAEKRKVDFRFKEPEAKLPQVSFDPSRLDIAIRNIIDNAIKYALPGGLVEIKFQAEKHSLFLIVRDNGIGISKEDQKFIFVKFFRAKNAIKLQPEGSGLGLFIAKNIAEKHNALLTFESEETKGTTFTFQFPLEPERMPKGIVQGL